MSFYQELVSTTIRILIAEGIDTQNAPEIARAVVEGIRQDFGGLVIYTPKNGNKTQDRDREIRKLFFENDFSYKELALRFNLTVRQIYRILKK